MRALQRVVTRQVTPITVFENVVGSDYNDSLTANNTGSSIDGGANNDSMTGGNANDTLLGGAGNDILYVSGGCDWIAGGSGIDTLDLTSIGASTDMWVNLATGQNGVVGYGGSDTLLSFENVRSGISTDLLTGDAYEEHSRQWCGQRFDRRWRGQRHFDRGGRIGFDHWWHGHRYGGLFHFRRRGLGQPCNGPWLWRRCRE